MRLLTFKCSIETCRSTQFLLKMSILTHVGLPTHDIIINQGSGDSKVSWSLGFVLDFPLKDGLIEIW
jgi:hypothetical protein